MDIALPVSRTDCIGTGTRCVPGGPTALISGLGVFYPDKRPTHRVGIIPDIEVKPTVAGIRAGRDEVLEEALRQVLGHSTQR
jgi:hypothetical protein